MQGSGQELVASRSNERSLRKHPDSVFAVSEGDAKQDIETSDSKPEKGPPPAGEPRPKGEESGTSPDATSSATDAGSQQASKPWYQSSTVWTIVATLVGVLIGAGVTYMNNNASITAQRDQTVEEFRRNHRQEVYATILKQATNIRNASTFSASVVGVLDQFGLSQGIAKAATAQRQPNGTVPTKPFSPSGSTGTTSLDTSSDASGAMWDKFAGQYQQNLGVVREDWQTAYTALDQAISDAEIVSSKQAIGVARALRDKYRNDYYESVLKQLNLKPNDTQPQLDVPKLADALVGVPIRSPEGYDASLLQKSTQELTEMFIQAAKEDLAFNDR